MSHNYLYFWLLYRFGLINYRTYRFSNSAVSCSYLAIRTCDKTTLVDKTLRTSYEQFTEKFFISKEKTRRGFLRLEELGIITRGVCNISLEKGGRCNKLMITIAKPL